MTMRTITSNGLVDTRFFRVERRESSSGGGAFYGLERRG